MSKYFKAEEVINMLIADYYTQALAEGYCVDEKAKEMYREDAERATEHLPTIEIVHCIECAYRGEDWWCYKHEFTPIPIEDFFCKDGEREDYE